MPEETKGNSCGAERGQVEIDVQLRPVQVEPVEQLHFEDRAQPGIAEPGEVLVREKILLVSQQDPEPQPRDVGHFNLGSVLPKLVRFHRAVPR